jgi:uncharacterized protein YbjT (DUF2867 family)
MAIRAILKIDIIGGTGLIGSMLVNFLRARGQTSGCKVLAAAAKAGVRHHLALSIVGTGRSSGLENPS